MLYLLFCRLLWLHDECPLSAGGAWISSGLSLCLLVPLLLVDGHLLTHPYIVCFVLISLLHYYHLILCLFQMSGLFCNSLGFGRHSLVDNSDLSDSDPDDLPSVPAVTIDPIPPVTESVSCSRLVEWW